MDVNRLGAIDIGSNAVKLLICDVINHKDRIVSKKVAHLRIPLQLGDDTFYLGYISDKKKDKLAHLIYNFKSFIEISGTEDFRICATSALREARNRSDIIEFVSATTGVNIELISTREEANFLFLGGMNGEYDSDTLYVIVDVGGGCTEIALSRNNELVYEESFKLGTIRILSRDEEKKEWSRLKEWLEEKRHGHRNICLIGSGSNINKVNSQFRRRKIKKSDLRGYYRKLHDMNLEERIVNSNLNLNGAEMILPAINIYLNIMKILKVEILQVPVIGIADGIIKDIYLKKQIAGK
ncbi:MAG: hypothetical protein LBV74_09295 [Tannerella sp.]|jgi:exopolyphosphatase/guanosine-5'-triphosphate,3'-diphosphate pyrophosphatase|nr:hypothetical protein [Tannerella sp.]